MMWSDLIRSVGSRFIENWLTGGRFKTMNKIFSRNFFEKLDNLVSSVNDSGRALARKFVCIEAYRLIWWKIRVEQWRDFFPQEKEQQSFLLGQQNKIRNMYLVFLIGLPLSCIGL